MCVCKLFVDCNLHASPPMHNVWQPTSQDDGTRVRTWWEETGYVVHAAFQICQIFHIIMIITRYPIVFPAVLVCVSVSSLCQCSCCTVYTLYTLQWHSSVDSLILGAFKHWITNHSWIKKYIFEIASTKQNPHNIYTCYVLATTIWKEETLMNSLMFCTHTHPSRIVSIRYTLLLL